MPRRKFFHKSDSGFEILLKCGFLLIFLPFGLLYIFFEWLNRTNKRRKKEKQDAEYYRSLQRIEDILNLNPKQFENFIGTQFKRAGYRVKITPHSGDEGVDLFIASGKEKAVVQCKRYKGSVGQVVVRDLYGTMIHNNAKKAYLVTTGNISNQAREWAKGKPIKMVDGIALIKWINSLEQRENINSREKSIDSPELISKFLPDTFKQKLSLTGITITGFLLIIMSILCSQNLNKHPNATEEIISNRIDTTKTFINSSIIIPSNTPIFIQISTSTSSITPRPSSTLINTPSPIGQAVVSAMNVNLRLGPGTSFEVIDYAKQGDIYPIYGRNREGNWILLSRDGSIWIAASLVELPENAKDIPVFNSPIPTKMITLTNSP